MQLFYTYTNHDNLDLCKYQICSISPCDIDNSLLLVDAAFEMPWLCNITKLILLDKRSAVSLACILWKLA